MFARALWYLSGGGRLKSDIQLWGCRRGHAYHAVRMRDGESPCLRVWPARQNPTSWPAMVQNLRRTDAGLHLPRCRPARPSTLFAGRGRLNSADLASRHFAALRWNYRWTLLYRDGGGAGGRAHSPTLLRPDRGICARGAGWKG